MRVSNRVKKVLSGFIEFLWSNSEIRGGGQNLSRVDEKQLLGYKYMRIFMRIFNLLSHEFSFEKFLLIQINFNLS